MEHPVDKAEMSDCGMVVRVKHLDDAGCQCIRMARENLGSSNKYDKSSGARFILVREALEYAMQAHAFGKNVSELIIDCRNALDASVAAQIDEANNG